MRIFSHVLNKISFASIPSHGVEPCAALPCAVIFTNTGFLHLLTIFVISPPTSLSSTILALICGYASINDSVDLLPFSSSVERITPNFIGNLCSTTYSMELMATAANDFISKVPRPNIFPFSVFGTNISSAAGTTSICPKTTASKSKLSVLRIKITGEAVV